MKFLIDKLYINNYRRKLKTRKRNWVPTVQDILRLVPVWATVTRLNSSQTYFLSHKINISSETEFTKIWDYMESMWNVHKARPLKHKLLVSTGFSNLVKFNQTQLPSVEATQRRIWATDFSLFSFNIENFYAPVNLNCKVIKTKVYTKDSCKVHHSVVSERKSSQISYGFLEYRLLRIEIDLILCDKKTKRVTKN